MCINPRRLDNGAEAWCRKCWQCTANYINDWVGRCVAESKTVPITRSVTLTYGRDAEGNSDHERASILTYSDVQKWLKLLRYHGYPVRYFAAGEFGSEKGRAHWHLILFFLRESPKHELMRNLVQAHWDHGYSYWEAIDDHARAVRYVCKYIQKDLRDAERQRQVGMSRFPPLGAVYFGGLARRYVEQGISPQLPAYHFPDVRDENGETIKFRLSHASKRLFIEAFLTEWAEKRGGHWPHSDMISEYLDQKAKYSQELSPRPFQPALSRPWIDPPNGGPMSFSPVHNSWTCVAPTGETLFWSFDLEGKRAWQSVIRTETQADRLREAFERRKGLPSYLEASRGR